MSRLDMYSHDIRRRGEQRPRGQGVFYAETLAAEWDRGREGGGRVEDDDEEEGCLSYCTK